MRLDTDELLTLSDIAVQIGHRYGTLYRLAKRGQFPDAIKVGHISLYRRSDIPSIEKALSKRQKRCGRPSKVLHNVRKENTSVE